MRKYFQVVRATIQDELEYPAGVLYWFFLDLIRLFLMIYLWLAIYRDNVQIAGFDLKSILTYYFLILVIYQLHAHVSFWFADLVKDGRISGYLLKPMSFLRFLILRTASRKIVELVLALPVIVLVFVSLQSYLVTPASFYHLILFGAAVSFSVILFIFLGFNLGLVSFWTLEIGSLFYFYYNLVEFLGGAFLPLSFFPGWLVNFLNFLPFKYLYYFPVAIFLGQVSLNEAVFGVAVSFAWLVVLYLSYKIIWFFGLRHYNVFGG